MRFVFFLNADVLPITITLRNVDTTAIVLIVGYILLLFDTIFFHANEIPNAVILFFFSIMDPEFFDPQLIVFSNVIAFTVGNFVYSFDIIGFVNSDLIIVLHTRNKQQMIASNVIFNIVKFHANRPKLDHSLHAFVYHNILYFHRTSVERICFFNRKKTFSHGFIFFGK